MHVFYWYLATWTLHIKPTYKATQEVNEKSKPFNLRQFNLCCNTNWSHHMLTVWSEMCVCVWFCACRYTPRWPMCGKLRLPDKKEEAYHNTHQTHTNTRPHTLLISRSFLVLPSTLSSLALPSSSQTLPTVLPSWQLQAPWKMSLACITIAQDRFH